MAASATTIKELNVLKQHHNTFNVNQHKFQENFKTCVGLNNKKKGP
jgi:hypothetical protein